MTGADQSSLLRRKMGGAGRDAGARTGVPGEIAVMRACARAAYTAAGLKVEMRETSVDTLDGIAPLAGRLATAMLVVPFTAPDGVEGYVALSQEFAQSLIEKATTGRLSKLPLEPRRASSIDLLLCRDFLLRFLENWREIASGSPDADWLDGYAPRDTAVDVDLMVLNSRDIAYRAFTVKLRFDDTRDAVIEAAFPAERRARAEVQACPPPEGRDDWGALWRDAVLDSQAELDAVLHRLTLPLRDVRGWSPGDLVELPASALGTVMLGRRGGAVVATARLGQARGSRALRLNALTRLAGGAAPLQGDAAPPTTGQDGPPAPGFEERAPIARTQGALPSASPTAQPPAPEPDRPGGIAPSEPGEAATGSPAGG